MQLPTSQFRIEQIIAAFCMTKCCKHVIALFTHATNVFYLSISKVTQVVRQFEYLIISFIYHVKLLVCNLYAFSEKSFVFPALFRSRFVKRTTMYVQRKMHCLIVNQPKSQPQSVIEVHFKPEPFLQKGVAHCCIAVYRFEYVVEKCPPF